MVYCMLWNSGLKLYTFILNAKFLTGSPIIRLHFPSMQMLELFISHVCVK